MRSWITTTYQFQKHMNSKYQQISFIIDEFEGDKRDREKLVKENGTTIQLNRYYFTSIKETRELYLFDKNV